MTTSKDEALKLLKDTNPEKTFGTDKSSGWLLKDDAVVLALSISKLSNLLMKRSKFSSEFQNCQTQAII